MEHMATKSYPVHHNKKPIKIGSFEFANPFDVPLQRRLETLGALIYLILFVFAPFLCVYFPLKIFFTSSYWWLMLLYAIWYWHDYRSPERGGHVWPAFKRATIFKWLRDYFPIALHKTVDLDPSRNYICGYHPHGLVAVGAFVCFATEACGFPQMFKGIRSHLVGLVGQFAMPFRRELLMFTDIHGSSKESITNLINSDGPGNAVVIVIGGVAEVMDSYPGRFDLTLKNRKGFVKLALKNGADLLPIFSFGENEIYYQVKRDEHSLYRRFQNFVRFYVGVPPMIPKGRGIFSYSFGLLPYRHPIDVVVGKPIRVEKTEQPTPEQISELHQKYIDGLIELFEENKTRFGIDEDAKLNLV